MILSTSRASWLRYQAWPIAGYLATSYHRIFPAIVWKCQEPRVSSDFFHSRSLGHRNERNMQICCREGGGGLLPFDSMAAHHRCFEHLSFQPVRGSTVRRCFNCLPDDESVTGILGNLNLSHTCSLLFARFLFAFHLNSVALCSNRCGFNNLLHVPRASRIFCPKILLP